MVLKKRVHVVGIKPMLTLKPKNGECTLFIGLHRTGGLDLRFCINLFNASNERIGAVHYNSRDDVRPTWPTPNYPGIYLSGGDWEQWRGANDDVAAIILKSHQMNPDVTSIAVVMMVYSRGKSFSDLPKQGFESLDNYVWWGEGFPNPVEIGKVWPSDKADGQTLLHLLTVKRNQANALRVEDKMCFIYTNKTGDDVARQAIAIKP